MTESIRNPEPPWDDLDDGIRATVRALWDAGFVTTDSGDGELAGEKADMTCASEFAHVYMVCPAAALVAEADRLARLVASWPAAATGDSYSGNPVEASYAPADGLGVLMLCGRMAPP